jgi:hypothetical protein
VRPDLDVKLQMAAEQALVYGIDRARKLRVPGLLGTRTAVRSSRSTARRLDPRARVVPDLPPSLYVGRVRQSALDAAG